MPLLRNPAVRGNLTGRITGPGPAWRIVSHRGEHDNRRVFENTLAAFDAAVAQGVWGIEFDLRWTRDLEPVVIHDPDLRRVFGRPLRVGGGTLHDLRKECSQVPTLAEVVGRYGGKAHLMVEIKAEPYPDRDRQNRVLGELFAALKPGRDYHLLSLVPEMFRHRLCAAGGVRSGGAPELRGP